MVAQVACIHAQGFGINFVPLHHIVAKAPCIARGTMLKPGSSPGFFSFGCTRIFLFLDIKKRPKLLKFGRFVYIFVYVLRKTLIFKVYCGERGIRTPGTSQYAGFQDRCIRPLCHLSNSLDCISAALSIVTFRFTFAGAKVVINVGFAKLFIKKFHKKVKKSGSSLYI